MADEESKRLLTEWGLSSHIPKFVEVSLKNFAILDADDLKELFTSFGDRITFKKKRAEWLKSSLAVQVDINGNSKAGGSSNQNNVVGYINGSNGDAQETVTGQLANVDIVIETVASFSSDTPSSPERESSTTVINTQSYDILNILNSTEDGKVVLRLYDNGGKTFKESSRDKLANCIVLHEINGDVDKRIPRSRWEFIAKEIAKYFSSEIPETWYYKCKDADGKELASGKLLWKYYNKRREWAKCGLIQTSQRSQEAARPTPLPISPDVQGSLLWLEANNTPWHAVIEHWKITFPFRHSLRLNPVRAPNGAVDSIQQLINKFKPLQSGNGYELLDCDFKELYPGKGMCLFQEWSTLAAFLEQEIKIVDPNFICEDEENEEHPPIDRTLRLLMSYSKLFGVVTVASRKRRKNDPEGLSTSYRPSHAVMQDSFLLNSQTVLQMEEVVKKRRDVLFNVKQTLQPFAAVIGPLSDPKQYLVVLDQFFYEVESPLKALDIVFKCIHTLHLGYPVEALGMWLFIQQSVFGITSRKDKINSHVKGMNIKYQAFKAQLQNN